MHCPHLPAIEPHIKPGCLLDFGTIRNHAFHQTALQLAQWYLSKRELPKALLALNRASAIPKITPPYAAYEWILANYAEHSTYGNPVRHFQHLASRMSGPDQELRTWRTWACFHLAENLLDPAFFPRDQLQIDQEHLRIPTKIETLKALETVGEIDLPDIVKC